MAEGVGIVIEGISGDKIAQTIGGLDSDKLKEMNRVILEKQEILTMDKMTQALIKNCYE